MKRIGQCLYQYGGYTVDGLEANTGIDWRILRDGEWIISLPRKRDCKEWIDAQA
jgi:hypothetical protein